MRIDEYYVLIQSTIAGCLWIETSSIAYAERSNEQCFIRGDIRFIDNSRLHFREYVDCEPVVERLSYSYTYLRPDSSLIFRYDNTPHHIRLGIVSFPHHKHVYTENNIVESACPELQDVLNEIGSFIFEVWQDD